LTRGKPSLLAVYSGACAHCGSRLPGLAMFGRELARAGIPVIGIEYMGTPESVRATSSRFELGFPLLADGNGRVCGLLGVGEFTLLVLDGDRRILYRGGLEDPDHIRSFFQT
jgi:peroxiredoxin